MDYARYLYENPDVSRMYSDGGRWSWDNARQQNAYMRNDGSPLQAETAAEYAAAHYRNFGKREGRQLHDMSGTDYAAKLRGSSGSATPSTQNAAMDTLQKQVSELTQSIADSAQGQGIDNNPVVDASRALASTFLSTDSGDSKKKRSFLTPIGGQS